ncbi:MAG TPA: class I SAM-dependent methyltransferase [Candidatus Binatia bacterium]|nr:class I SAM-dependent methyltransferase [Candidatus Binatia bacterium]
MLSDLLGWVEPWYRFRRRLGRRRGRARDLAKVRATGGRMTAAECEALYDLAREAKDGCIVEIGTFRGKSTVACALGARAGGGARVWAVDPFIPFVGACGGRFGPGDKVALLRNLLLADVAEQVWMLHAPSTQAAAGWREPIALLWLDGDHTYEAVRSDLDAWAPFVVAGGTVAFHDSLDPALGPRRLIEELLARGGWERVRVVDTLTVLRKTA